ncbi:MAG: hypothetical protein KAI40_03255 [Desulfobacterales bacterium]|nr:hypothetical protein [Desulfobacterales bacterium]
MNFCVCCGMKINEKSTQTACERCKSLWLAWFGEPKKGRVKHEKRS